MYIVETTLAKSHMARPRCKPRPQAECSLLAITHHELGKIGRNVNQLWISPGSPLLYLRMHSSLYRPLLPPRRRDPCTARNPGNTITWIVNQTHTRNASHAMARRGNNTSSPRRCVLGRCAFTKGRRNYIKLLPKPSYPALSL